MEFCLGLILGIILGIVYVQYRIRVTVNAVLNKLGEDMIAHTPRSDDIRNMKLIRIEINNSIMYAYDADTNVFVGQGSDLDDLAKSIEKYCKIASTEIDGKIMWFIDGTALDDLSKLDDEFKIKT